MRLAVISVGVTILYMRHKKELEMITPKEYAALHNVAYTTVVNWLRKELIEGAQKVELPHMKSYVYAVPKDAKPPELKPGPKPGATQKKKRVRRKSDT
jgi:hypothetical protein